MLAVNTAQIVCFR